MSHFLSLPIEDRPDLPTREPAPDYIEVKCGCGAWRPGFTLYPVNPPRDGRDWACDGCRSRWAREDTVGPG